MDPYHPQRVAMVEEQLRRRGIRDPRVLAVMERVPRHEFVDPAYQREAYADHPIPIGEGQTISQPYVVAAMAEALLLRPEDIVLEIGAGSGYQAAVLAELARAVYTVERHETLAARAAATLQRLAYKNVQVLVGDGSEGLPEHAPYNGILVAAAAPQIPPPLWEQLEEGGRMIVPVGNAASQQLELIRKIQGQPVASHLDLVRFVPLIGREGFREGW